MPIKLDRITDGELSILQFLWRRGEATSREITTELYEEVTDPKIASVQKLLERLQAKGCVDRDRSQRAHRFRPLVGEEEFLRSRLQALADRLCGGTLLPLVSALVRTKGFSRSQREQLRNLIGDLWPQEGGESESRRDSPT